MNQEGGKELYNSNEIAIEEYAKSMNAIKNLNMEIRELKKRSSYSYGRLYDDIKGKGVLFLIKKFFNKMSINYRKREKFLSSFKDLPTAFNNRNDCCYCIEDRIAVYTCIIGEYDQLHEPLIQPNNIDYYVITDSDISPTSCWIKIDPHSFTGIDKYDGYLKNRFFKMFPNIVFPNYKYSIYVDGNFKICSDFTEHVNRLSEYGMAFFRHSKRLSVKQEAEVCKILRKEKAENIDKYMERLIADDFPDNYGLLACNIIVREHNKKICIDVMNQWWIEFRDYVKRDQLSLPYVLYKNKITVNEVATLGGDVHKDFSFEIMKHR